MIFILLFYKYISHLCKKQSESIPGTFREHYSHSKSTSGALQDNSGNIPGTFREHYKKAAGCLSCSRRLFRFILISLFFSSVSRHLSAPFECCPPVIHPGRKDSKPARGSCTHTKHEFTPGISMYRHPAGHL